MPPHGRCCCSRRLHGDTHDDGPLLHRRSLVSRRADCRARRHRRRRRIPAIEAREDMTILTAQWLAPMSFNTVPPPLRRFSTRATPAKRARAAQAIGRRARFFAPAHMKTRIRQPGHWPRRRRRSTNIGAPARATPTPTRWQCHVRGSRRADMPGLRRQRASRCLQELMASPRRAAARHDR